MSRSQAFFSALTTFLRGTVFIPFERKSIIPTCSRNYCGRAVGVDKIRPWPQTDKTCSSAAETNFSLVAESDWFTWLTPGTVGSLSMSQHGETDGKLKRVGFCQSLRGSLVNMNPLHLKGSIPYIFWV